ncbi:MAG: CHASE3 domain-containing protein [Elusimicrobiota bacterium]
MADRNDADPVKKPAANDAALLLGVLTLVLATIVSVGLIVRRNVTAAVESGRSVAQAQLVVSDLANLLSDVKDAETGQRGFVITGDRRYLEPYRASLQHIDGHLYSLDRSIAGNARQRRFLAAIAPLVAAKLAELKTVIAARETGGFDPAKDLIVSNRGKNIMDSLRELVNRALRDEEGILRERTAAKAANVRDTIRAVLVGGFLSASTFLLLSIYLRIELVRRLRSEAALRSANTDLLQRTKELTEANADLDAFSSSVAHDLRAPIRHILGFTELFMEDYAPSLDDEARRRLGKVQDGARHMGRLVDDLLNLSKVTRQAAAPAVVSLGPLARDVIEQLKTEAEGRDVDWRLGELFEAKCDATLMRQVFVNLLSNSLKYTRPRRRAVIEIGATTAEGGERAVFVRDNGVGFDMRYADKLFGVFQRLHSEREFEGTGVGLATVDRILRKHGGRIWAHAELGKGATFFFTLEKSTAGKGES